MLLEAIAAELDDRGYNCVRNDDSYLITKIYRTIKLNLCDQGVYVWSVHRWVQPGGSIGEIVEIGCMVDYLSTAFIDELVMTIERLLIN